MDGPETCMFAFVSGFLFIDLILLSKSLAALNPTVDFLAGTIGGMAGLAVGFPFDTVKVRFQNPEMSVRYTTTTGAIFTILKEERIVGLYRGIASPMAIVALMNGLVFASYRFFLKIQLDNTSATPTLSQVALAGAACGIASSVATTPIELIKVLQQSTPYATSARSITLQLVRQKGIIGLYRGLGATALRDIGYGAYFYSYEATHRYLTSLPDTSYFPEIPSWAVLLLAGGVAGVAGWLATFPLDTIKTRIQSSCPADTVPLLNSRGKSPPSLPTPVQSDTRYNSVISTALHSYRDDGIAVFFRGLAPTLIRPQHFYPLLGFWPSAFPNNKSISDELSRAILDPKNGLAIPVNMVTFAMFEAIVQVAKSWGW